MNADPFILADDQLCFWYIQKHGPREAWRHGGEYMRSYILRETRAERSFA